jgi:O-antigen ligase
MNRISRLSLAPVWGAMSAILLSLGWLLPNHTKPWTSFESDAWVATVLAVIGLVVIVRARREVVWQGLAMVVVSLIPLAFVQWALDLLPFAGQAWIFSAYMIGFALALLVGQQWQAWRPTWMGDMLFSAIGIAAALSVTMQLQQWLGQTDTSTLDVWVRASNGSRPYANMGQPNQLATLLLWGLLACGWGVWRRLLGRAAALLASAFLLFGLALTQSRTGALALLAIVLGTWFWRPQWGARAVPWYVTGLAGFYAAALLTLSPLRRLLLLDVPASMVARLGHELRPDLWRLLLDAAWHRPWTGYGVVQVLSAQASVAESHPALHYPFLQAHNLFLEFVLWMGIPLGMLLSGCVLAWVITAALRVRHPPEILYFLFVLVGGLHAMLELPLHYAYFLLPTGLAMGALNESLKIWPIRLPSPLTGRPLLLGIWCLGVVLLGLIARDYFRVEESYTSLQLERAGIQGSHPAEPPEVLLLTDLREAQRFMTYEPVSGVDASTIRWARDATLAWPSSRSFMTLAILLGLNEHEEEARSWLVKMCLIVPEKQCATAPERWAEAQKLHPQLAAIEWPIGVDATPKPLP